MFGAGLPGGGTWDGAGIAANNSRIVRTTGSTLLGWFACYGVAGTEVILQFFNATAVPANGTQCIFEQVLGYQVAASGFEDIQCMLGEGHFFSTGIVWALSTTFHTLTGGTPNTAMVFTRWR